MLLRNMGVACVRHSSAVGSVSITRHVMTDDCACAGQGMIMGPKTAFSMLAGAIAGGVLDAWQCCTLHICGIVHACICC